MDEKYEKIVGMDIGAIFDGDPDLDFSNLQVLAFRDQKHIVLGIAAYSRKNNRPYLIQSSIRTVAITSADAPLAMLVTRLHQQVEELEVDIKLIEATYRRRDEIYNEFIATRNSPCTPVLGDDPERAQWVW